jgi:hypothetical protein
MRVPTRTRIRIIPKNNCFYIKRLPCILTTVLGKKKSPTNKLKVGIPSLLFYIYNIYIRKNNMKENLELLDLKKKIVCRYFKHLNKTIIFNKITGRYIVISGIGAFIMDALFKGKSKVEIERELIFLASRHSVVINHKFIKNNIELITNFLNNESNESETFITKKKQIKSKIAKRREEKKNFNDRKILDYRKIQRLYAREKIPMSMYIEITSACNFHCVHCYNRMPKEKFGMVDDISFSEIIKIFDWLEEKKCLKVTISGGEPLVRKDFLDIVKAAIDRVLQW